MGCVQHEQHCLTWEEHSDGAETLILIHGHGGVRQMWAPVAQRLADLGRCVTLDLPGHYPARVPDNYTSLSVDQLIDIETRAIEIIGRGRPVTLIGHSTGALVAFGVTARRPDLVRRLVSINGLIWGPPGGILGVGAWVLKYRLDPVFNMAYSASQLRLWSSKAMIASYVHNPIRFWSSTEAMHTYAAAYEWMRQQPARSLSIMLRTISSCDIRSQICSLSLPVLAITGAQDKIVSPEQSAWLARNLSHAVYIELADVGHMPNLEATDELVAILSSWLRA